MTSENALALFEVEAVPRVSAAAKRTRREQQTITAGFHPLTRGRLHPEATSGRPGAPTCGSCRFRRAVSRGPDREFPKCHFAYPVRMNNGPGTDVKASWPGCVDWQDKGRDTSR